MTSVRTARFLLALIVVLTAGGCITACSAAPEKGDCVEKDGDSYRTADCATAPLRVLERIEDTSGDCLPVAGVTETYSNSGSETTLCIGPRDVDPATAINVAQKGDCVAGIDANAEVRRVDCRGPAAEAVVLERMENASSFDFGGGGECSSVPGVDSTYTWDIVTTGDGATALDGLTNDLLFCLGPVGVDPASSLDTAQPGDCLGKATVSNDLAYAKVDCGDPAAKLRVTARVENMFVSPEVACESAERPTSTLKRDRGLNSYVLCLVPH